MGIFPAEICEQVGSRRFSRNFRAGFVKLPYWLSLPPLLIGSDIHRVQAAHPAANTSLWRRFRPHLRLNSYKSVLRRTNGRERSIARPSTFFASNRSKLGFCQLARTGFSQMACIDGMAKNLREYAIHGTFIRRQANLSKQTDICSGVAQSNIRSS